MTPERLRLVSELYDAATAMNAEERTRFIDERCANDEPGRNLRNEGKFAQAETLYRQALEIQRRVLTLKHDDTLFTMMQLGSIKLGLGKYQEGEALAREASENIRQFLGPEHPYSAVSFHVLANAYAHSDTLATLSDYAALYQGQVRTSGESRGRGSVGAKEDSGAGR